jgi:hypothetical protein
MKKSIILATIVACFALSNAKAQMVKGVRLSEIRADYIEIKAINRVFSEKIWINLEYGQKVINENADAYIKDDNNKELEFNSAIDCVNKMRSYGYELFQVYVVKTGETNNKIYVLKRTS